MLTQQIKKASSPDFNFNKAFLDLYALNSRTSAERAVYLVFMNKHPEGNFAKMQNHHSELFTPIIVTRSPTMVLAVE